VCGILISGLARVNMSKQANPKQSHKRSINHWFDLLDLILIRAFTTGTLIWILIHHWK